MTVSNIRQNIIIDAQGGSTKIEPGKPHLRYITLHNRSKEKVNLVIWLYAKDANSQTLLRWYHFEKIDNTSERKRELPISIEAERTKEVKLIFEIPQSAEPRVYNYEIRAQDTNTGIEVSPRPQQLQIPFTQQYRESRKEPNYQITPQTNSEQPYLLEPGQALPIDIRVENRSHLVDRFNLTFPELDKSWFEDYTDELPLNPGGVDNFKLSLRPPAGTPAGEYFSTIRLRSQNENQVFLGVIYFTIQVSDRLTAELSPPSRTIPSANKSFELKVFNPGNISRHVRIDVRDDEGVFEYLIQPDYLEILSSKEEKIVITPIVKKELIEKRFWKGEEVTIPFQVYFQNTSPEIEELEAIHNLSRSKLINLDNAQPLTLDALPEIEIPGFYLPENISGSIIWKPNPSWQPWALRQTPKILIWALILLALIALGNFANNWIWQFIVKPTLKPTVTGFSTTEKNYQIRQQNEINLNWEISNIAQLSQVKLTAFKSNINLHTISYNFTFNQCDTGPVQGDKESSQKVSNSFMCGSMIQELSPERNNFISFNKPNWQEPSKKNPIQIYNINAKINTKSNSEQSNICQLEVVPARNKSFITKIWEFIYKDKPEMQENVEYQNKVLKCNMVSVADLSIQPQLIATENKIKVLERDGYLDIKSMYELFNLKNEFNNLITFNNIDKAGNYDFKIDIIPNDISGESSIPSASQTIKDVKVLPAQPEPPLQPEIQTFASTVPIYRETNTQDTTSNKPRSQTKTPATTIKLNLAIANPENISSLVIQGIRTELNGTIRQLPKKTYSLNNLIGNEQTKTPKLTGCEYESKILTCRNIPIEGSTPGQYQFSLTVIPRAGEKTQHLKPVTKNIDAVQIKPMLPEITNFKVNDQDTLTRPNHVFKVDPNRGALDVFMDWEVKNRDHVTVELLPAPGVLPKNIDKVKYSLSPNPGSTTLTLRATNQIGESVMRSVVLESVPVASIPPNNPAATRGTGASQTAPTPPADGSAPNVEEGTQVDPENLPPFELPPRAN
jgi:hypothetical protein